MGAAPRRLTAGLGFGFQWKSDLGGKAGAAGGPHDCRRCGRRLESRKGGSAEPSNSGPTDRKLKSLQRLPNSPEEGIPFKESWIPCPTSLQLPFILPFPPLMPGPVWDA